MTAESRLHHVTLSPLIGWDRAGAQALIRRALYAARHGPARHWPDPDQSLSDDATGCAAWSRDGSNCFFSGLYAKNAFTVQEVRIRFRSEDALPT